MPFFTGKNDIVFTVILFYVINAWEWGTEK